MKVFLRLLFFGLCFNTAPAQLPTYQNYDCNFYKELLIPLRHIEKTGETRQALNQSVFYGYRDQFTYWYRILVKENTPVTFKVDPLNDSDSYSVFVYQYNTSDFCKKVYDQKVKPVRNEFFSLVNKEDPYDLSQKKFNALAGNTYYISVLNTSVNNCGHRLILFDGKDTLRLKAVHVPCKRDLAALSVKSVSIKTKRDTLSIKKTDLPAAKKDSVILTSGIPVLACYIKNKKNNSAVDYKPLVTEATSNDELAITPLAKGEWAANIVKGNSYKIKCSLLGYKSVTINITSQNNDTTKAIVMLEPLKAGDVFVMKSIYFYPNTYALKRESADELQKLLGFLQNNEEVVIEIQGHTNGDNRVAKNKSYAGLGEEWNFQGSAKELSLKRAEAIKKFLETHGITSVRLVPKGYGGKKPVIADPQNNEEGQMNIRVEVVILKA
ncbi:MAG TPA: OmpA family protein [Bacteroidia bacterium]|jgi:outer membrane protein OmpA-like peptidoglycan-associated protein|nr:OmpA family protein [Bacteroidia bacterium]